ncbi:MAG: winged helix-turn-helix transcriptional regulator, partial [Ruminococcus sp.]|nr:winged helix-turn-helix transcriptional regulator [Ruminococcus sp.]
MEDYKYMTIVEWSKNFISSHKLKPKDRFLTEKELCEIHGVSRQTVRQALMCLENENVISRVRGSGAFVASGYAQGDTVGQIRNIGV